MPIVDYVNNNVNNWSKGLSSMRQSLPFFSSSNRGSMAFGVDDAIGIGNAFGNLIGGFLNYKSQKAQMQQQRNFFNEQMAFNEKWNKTNYDNENYWKQYDYDYNTPENQVKRLRAAGLNPSLMMGQMSPGGSSMPAGSGDNPAPGSPNIETPRPGDMVSGLASSFGQGRMLSEQIQFQREKTKEQLIENMYRAAKLQSEINNANSRTKGQDISNRLSNLDLTIKSDMKEVTKGLMRGNLDQLHLQNNMIREETRGMIIDNNLKPDYLKVAQDEIELGKRNADLRAQEIKNDYILGMKHAANEAKLTDAQCENLTSMSNYYTELGAKLKYANEHFVGLQYGGKVFKLPYSFMVEYSQTISNMANAGYTRKEIENYAKNMILKEKSIEIEGSKKDKSWISDLGKLFVDGALMFLAFRNRAAVPAGAAVRGTPTRSSLRGFGRKRNKKSGNDYGPGRDNLGH